MILDNIVSSNRISVSSEISPYGMFGLFSVAFLQLRVKLQGDPDLNHKLTKYQENKLFPT